MSFMTATAVITAIDRASGVFARVANSARTASGRYAAAAGSFAAAGHKMHGALAMAAPTALGIGTFGHDQYEWDRAIHQYQAIAELSPTAFAGVNAAIMSISNAVGVNKMELLEAAKGWQELGNSPESFIKNAEVAARTSRITGVTVAEQMKESSALMRAWGNSMGDAAMFKHYEEVYLVASKGMKGGAHAFGEAMQSWAPVAAGLGLTFEEASAFVQTLGGQFEPSAISNALKTSFLRLANPVPKAEAFLRSQNIDRGKLFNYDPAAVGDADALINMLKGSGSFSVTHDVENMIRQDLANVDLSKGAAQITDKLNEDLAHAFGGKHMSAQDRKILQASILQHMSSAARGLNPAEFFKVFGPLSKNLAFMSAVFGKEHAAKIMDLLKQWEHFSHNFETIMQRSSGALERKWSIFGEGFAMQWDRAKASIDNFMNSIGGSGIKGDLTGVFDHIAGFFEASQAANPEVLRLTFWGVAGLAALAPSLYVISGIATGLTTLAAIAASPITLTLVGGYLLYEAVQNWDALKNAALHPIDFVIKEWHEIKSLTDEGPKTQFQHPSLNLIPGELMRLNAQHARGTADVNVNNRITVDVNGPGTVTRHTGNGASVSVPLKTGRSMPDTGH